MKIAFAPTIENKAEHHIHLILEACKWHIIQEKCCVHMKTVIVRC